MKNAMPTMKDVAQEAGVALGTVSKVFNGIPVGESYRIKVEEAARKLGYQVNQYARGLKTNKTNTVAVILPGVNHPFFAALAHHICEALARRDYRMLLYVTASNPEIEQNCVNMVRQNKADGIIGLTYNPLAVDEELPFVGIDRSFRADIPCVAADNYGGGRLAAEKLLELGRALRHAPAFPKGANVNFYDIASPQRITELTYERGVEDFTYACGTGTGATVTALTLLGKVSGEDVAVSVPGGLLRVTVERTGEAVKDLCLTGPTNTVCEGEVLDEALTALLH